MGEDMCVMTTDTAEDVIQNDTEEIPQHAINCLAGFFLKRMLEESMQAV